MHQSIERKPRHKNNFNSIIKSFDLISNIIETNSISTHPRTRKKLEELKSKQFYYFKTLGFFIKKLQSKMTPTLSDSGTIQKKVACEFSSNY